MRLCAVWQASNALKHLVSYTVEMLSAIALGPFYFTLGDLLWTGACVLGAWLLGQRYGARLAQQGLSLENVLSTGRRPWLFLVSFLSLCGGVAAVYKLPPGYLHPYWLGVFEPLSWALTKSAPVFLMAMAFGLKPQGKKQRQELKTLALLTGVALVGIQAVQSPFVRPIDPKTIQVRKAKDGSVLQSTNVTCTAATLANGLAFYGIETTEAESASRLGTRRSGTALHQVLSGVSHYGMVATAVQATPDQLIRLRRPTVVSVWLMGDILHSILVYGGDAHGNLFIIDPMSGKATYSQKHYLKQAARSYQLVLTPEEVPEIGPHSSKQQLREVQLALHEQGFSTPQDGLWSTELSLAIRQFQRQQGLPEQGRLDPLSWLVLTGPRQGIQQGV